MKGTYIVIGNENTPSSRIRAYRYLPLFASSGWDVVCLKATDLYAPASLYRLLTSDWVIIQKSIISGAALKLLRTLGVKLFYDFDDAIQLKFTPAKYPKFLTNLRAMDKVLAGNETLAAFAREHNSRVAIIPTPIELEKEGPDPPILPNGPFVVGWIGTQPNLKYLELVLPALERLLAEGHELVLHVVSSEPPPINTTVPVRFSPWELPTENELIDTFDVGIMPLENGEWERGKCSYKLLSYMAHWVPAVASPVGMNADVVAHGQNGYLATTTEEWATALRALLTSPEKREKIADRGYRTVAEQYARPEVFARIKREIELTVGRNL